MSIKSRLNKMKSKRTNVKSGPRWTTTWQRPSNQVPDSLRSAPYQPTDYQQEAVSRTCSDCGFEAGANGNFCTRCGKSRHQRIVNSFCSNCGFETGTTARFCSRCGQRRTYLPASVGSKQPGALSKDYDRERILETSVMDAISRGWRVESQGKFHAVIVKDGKVNHILHLLLTLLTGFWIVIWFLLAVFGGKRRQMIYVNEQGYVSVTRA